MRKFELRSFSIVKWTKKMQSYFSSHFSVEIVIGNTELLENRVPSLHPKIISNFSMYIVFTKTI